MQLSAENSDANTDLILALVRFRNYFRRVNPAAAGMEPLDLINPV
jgi:hypothetical protein